MYLTQYRLLASCAGSLALTFTLAACTQSVGSAPPGEPGEQTSRQSQADYSHGAAFFLSNAGSNSAFVWNQNGQAISVAHAGTGIYSVTLKGDGPSNPSSGVVHAFGSAIATTCMPAKPAQRYGTSDAVFYNECFNSDGTPTNSPFLATFMARQDYGGVEGGYAYFSTQGGTVVHHGGRNQDRNVWNSTQGTVTAYWMGPGVYHVVFAGQQYIGGVAFATAEGGVPPVSPKYCEIANSYLDDNNVDQDVDINCFDPTTKNTADTPFSVTATLGTPAGTSSYAYAWADQPYATSSYIADYTYQRSYIAVDQTQCEPNLAPISVAPAPSGLTGQYVVTFPGMPFTATTKSSVMVEAFGTAGEFCEVDTWTGGPSSAQATVSCFDAYGNGTPVQFNIAYLSTYYLIC